MRSNEWEILELSSTGTITRPGRTFTMGRAIVGEIAFTRDGKIGAVAQDDGSVGIFKLDDVGTPTVLHAMFKGDFYANKVVAAPDGNLFILDNQWRENGGGIYRLSIDCNDNVTDGGLRAASRLPAGVGFRTDGTAVLAAVNIGSSPEAGSEAHLLDWGGGTPAVLASTDLFPEDMAIMGGVAVSTSGSTLFVGDTSGFSSAPNSVVIADLVDNTFGDKQRIDVEDPMAIVVDPERDQALVASGFGDAVFVLDKPSTMWRSREVTYVGGKPQLPSGMTVVTAGSLRGRILLAELSGVRQLRFTATGVEDLGRFTIGMAIEDSTGAIGVTP